MGPRRESASAIQAKGSPLSVPAVAGAASNACALSSAACCVLPCPSRVRLCINCAIQGSGSPNSNGPRVPANTFARNLSHWIAVL